MIDNSTSINKIRELKMYVHKNWNRNVQSNIIYIDQNYNNSIVHQLMNEKVKFATYVTKCDLVKKRNKVLMH